MPIHILQKKNKSTLNRPYIDIYTSYKSIYRLKISKKQSKTVVNYFHL